MKKSLIIDISSYITDYFGENSRFLVQEKVFEYVQSRPTKYLKDYKILYNKYSEGAKYIEELIEDWDLEYYAPVIRKPSPSNKDKVNVIKQIVKEGKDGDALIFFNYDKREDDMGNNIILDQCSIDWSISLKVCRVSEHRAKIV